MVEVKALGARRTNALTVGELAQRSGVAISALHFYEKKGLIEGWRTSGNQRRYPRAMLRRVAVIRIAQRAGVPLSVLSNFLEGLQLQRVEGDEWNALAEAWQGLLDERIAALRQLRDDLDRCIGCGCLSLADCPLRNPGDRLGKEGSGARLLPRSSA